MKVIGLHLLEELLLIRLLLSCFNFLLLRRQINKLSSKIINVVVVIRLLVAEVLHRDHHLVFKLFIVFPHFMSPIALAVIFGEHDAVELIRQYIVQLFLEVLFLPLYQQLLPLLH